MFVCVLRCEAVLLLFAALHASRLHKQATAGEQLPTRTPPSSPSFPTSCARAAHPQFCPLLPPVSRSCPTGGLNPHAILNAILFSPAAPCDKAVSPGPSDGWFVRWACLCVFSLVVVSHVRLLRPRCYHTPVLDWCICDESHVCCLLMKMLRFTPHHGDRLSGLAATCASTHAAKARR